MQAEQTEKIRSRLRGKPLGLFDMLADGGPVEIETLFEALNSQEGDFVPSEMEERIRRYAAQLNMELAPQGLRTAHVGAAGYIMVKDAAGKARDAALRAQTKRLAAPESSSARQGRVFFFEKKNQKTFATSRTSAG
jgi:hypothetical protein